MWWAFEIAASQDQTLGSAVAAFGQRSAGVCMFFESFGILRFRERTMRVWVFYSHLLAGLVGVHR